MDHLAWEFTNLGLELSRLKNKIPLQFQGVVVACSGGLDSTVLLRILWQFTKEKFFFPLAAFHMNYGLRQGESDEDEAFLQRLTTQLSIPLYAKRITEEARHQRQGESIQEWARRLRYAELEGLAKEGWLIALAHHQDDLAENVILRLARGSSAGHLAGMRIFEAPYWRPLLLEKKAAIARYATKMEISHREDCSNAKMEYSRNVIRHKVMPELDALFPGASERIAACALEAQDLSSWCQERLDQELSSQTESNLAVLRRLPRGVALEGLARLIQKGASAPLQLSRHLLGEILTWITESKQVASWSKHLPGKRCLKIEGDCLTIEAPKEEIKQSRASQHERSLALGEINALLEPNSHAFIKVSQGIMLQLDHSPDRLLGAFPQPTTLKVYGTGSEKTLKFKGFSKSWRFKALMQMWKVPLSERRNYLVVQQDGLPLGLFDSRDIVVPSPSGEKTRCSQLSISLQYW